ncbi:preprotein translocase subunit SecA [Brachybacterium vulturis]|uniref:Preprotein translocase subunit SecA n=1 Tax=Brachybacterium vulturis TaxID=2017484 RepID=A0A291GNU9_9MICO|nr:YchJ family protein [Brachybacterium vulturis]ATG51634.1 preprotein translocase subunit SecA [Brachybacterium vulturis]
MSSSAASLPDASRCPCGSGDTYGACCGPVLRQERRAATAVALMRSRYTAFTVGDVDHLLRSWHRRTRPERAELTASPAAEVRWLRLDVLATSAGGPFDEAGTVEFTAVSKGPRGRQQQHELSRFVRVDGSWFYVDGDA